MAMRRSKQVVRNRHNPIAKRTPPPERKGTTIEMNKSIGQHLLKNPQVVTSIVEKANIKNTDIVLEIGSGTGNLTMKLLGVAKKVIAIEIDPRMIAELQKKEFKRQHMPVNYKLYMAIF